MGAMEDRAMLLAASLELDTGRSIRECCKVFALTNAFRSNRTHTQPNMNLGSTQWISGLLRTKVPLGTLSEESVIYTPMMGLTGVNVRLGVHQRDTVRKTKAITHPMWYVGKNKMKSILGTSTKKCSKPCTANFNRGFH